MSQKNVTICVLKLVVADCCLVSINVATGVSLVNIRLLPSTTDKINFYVKISYKLIRVVQLEARGPYVARHIIFTAEAFRKNLQM